MWSWKADVRGDHCLGPSRPDQRTASLSTVVLRHTINRVWIRLLDKSPAFLSRKLYNLTCAASLINIRARLTERDQIIVETAS